MGRSINNLLHIFYLIGVCRTLEYFTYKTATNVVVGENWSGPKWETHVHLQEQFWGHVSVNTVWQARLYLLSRIKVIWFFASSRVLPLHDSAKILLAKLQAYQAQAVTVREYYQKEHMNYKQVDGEKSKWQVWNSALEVGTQSVQQIQVYLQKTKLGEWGAPYEGPN